MKRRAALLGAALLFAGAGAAPTSALADEPTPAWSAAEKPVSDDIDGLRKVPDAARGAATRSLAARIRALPPAPNALRLALELSELCTEGDFGAGTVQTVADTLTATLRAAALPYVAPPAGDRFEAAYLPALAYQELAQLERYEAVAVALPGDAHYQAALAKVDAEIAARRQAELDLRDLDGHAWTLSALRGHVVLVNFWATWCPPCRKELPDLDALYRQYRERGLVILGVTDEAEAKVAPFVARQHLTYPVLLDPGRAVNTRFAIHGIPKSFVYDRDGRLIAQAIDMRTRRQLEAMLAKAGLH